MITKFNLKEALLVPFGHVGRGVEVMKESEVNGRMSAAVIELRPNEAFKPHVHPSDHLLLIIEGSGRLDCWEGRQYFSIELKKDDIVPVPKQYKHAFGAGSEGCRFLSVATPARLLADPHRLRHV